MKFKQWLSEHNLTKAEFCRQSGLEYRALNLWLSGASEPILSSYIAFSKGVLAIDMDAYPLDFLPMEIFKQKAEDAALEQSNINLIKTIPVLLLC